MEQDPTSNSKATPLLRLLLLILLLVVIGAVFVTFIKPNFLSRYFEADTNEETYALSLSEFQEEVAQLVAEAEAQPFVFELVPSAIEEIILAAPADTATADSESYQALKPDPGMFVADDVEDDTVYAFAFKDDTYGEYINNSEHQFTLYQLHDELRQVTNHFNELYQRPVFSARAEGVEQIGSVEAAIFGGDTPSVYPSVRAVEGFLVGEIMARLEPAKASDHRIMGAEYAERGVIYGHYAVSDVEASHSLVEQYFKLLDAAQPELFSSNQATN